MEYDNPHLNLMQHMYMIGLKHLRTMVNVSEATWQFKVISTQGNIQVTACMASGILQAIQLFLVAGAPVQ